MQDVRRAPLQAALIALVLCGATPGARAEETGLEYRLVVNDGEPLAFPHDDKERYFSRLPFMTAAGFASVAVRPSTNPNFAGKWEVVLTHTALGRVKLRAVADADRSREYCLVFHSVLYECSGFPVASKDVYDKGTVLANYTREQAELLAGAMRKEIEKARRR